MGCLTDLFCCCYVFWIQTSIVFQLIGFFSDSWVQWDGCDKQGLFGFSTSNTTNTTHGCVDHISPVSLALEATAVTFYMSGLLLGMLQKWCCKDSDSCEDCVGCTFGLLFIFAAILSVIGCCVMLTIDVPEYTLGWSFYCCLGSGLYNIAQIVLICCVSLCSSDCCTGKDARVNQDTDGGGYQTQHVGDDDLHVTGILVFVRIRILRVVTFVRKTPD
ncbi:uncharacterized protein [Argopecten irradians]|uniref:uncharacterized protein n=1 Tax=Argopecten irradians TaxID=31199 RepID=UPI00371F3B6E